MLAVQNDGRAQLEQKLVTMYLQASGIFQNWNHWQNLTTGICLPAVCWIWISSWLLPSSKCKDGSNNSILIIKYLRKNLLYMYACIVHHWQNERIKLLSTTTVWGNILADQIFAFWGLKSVFTGKNVHRNLPGINFVTVLHLRFSRDLFWRPYFPIR